MTMLLMTLKYINMNDSGISEFLELRIKVSVLNQLLNDRILYQIASDLILRQVHYLSMNI